MAPNCETETLDLDKISDLAVLCRHLLFVVGLVVPL